MASEGEVEKWIPNADEIQRPPSLDIAQDANDHVPDTNGSDEVEEADDKKDDKLQEPSNAAGLSPLTSDHTGDDRDNIDSDATNLELMNNFIPLPPKLPALSSSDSLMDITPYSSNNTGNENDHDEYVIYTDSEIGSQNSLDLRNVHSEDIDNSPTRAKARRNKSSTSRRSSPRRGSPGRESPQRRESPHRREGSKGDSHDLASGKPKKRIRRKSNKSDGSERSHPIGSGYTLTPAAGKVFRNLLILEESLREQVSQQKALRRKYLTFMAIMCSLIASISHHLYFANHLQTTSSPFRVVLTFILLALLVTLLLYYLSGEYLKTIVLPRKFLSSTNRGLRQLNIRLVKIKTPLTDKMTDLIRDFLLFIITSCLFLLHKFDPSTEKNKNSKLEVFLVSCQLQCQPRIGITDVKLVLNARVFNTDIREGWELYRSEFWIGEGVRRRNDLMNFVTTNSEDSILDKEKLLKRDKRERRDRKRTNTNPSPMNNKLNDQNLKELAFKLKGVDSPHGRNE